MSNADTTQRHRICFVTDSIDGGGIGSVFLSLSRTLVELGHDVDIVLFMAPRCELPSGVNVIVLGTRARYALFHLTRQFRKIKPDLIVSARDYVDLMALLARACAGQRQTPLVWSYHTHQTLEAQHKTVMRRVLGRLVMALSGRVDHLVAVSNGVARDVEARSRLAGGRVKTIYNPVCTPIVTPQIAHPWLVHSNEPVIVACGRLVPQKDFTTLISAFVLLRQSHPARLLILGEGPLRDPLQRQINQSGVADVIQLLGEVVTPAAFMKDASCFVSSARWEGFGMAIAEAMAVGCPIVATDCPSGPSEVLADGAYGALVPVANADALAKALAATLDRGHDPRPAQASLDRFDPTTIANAYLDLILPKS